MGEGIRQKPALFQWTPKRIRAAQLLAEGVLTDAEIANAVSIHRDTVYEWKKHPTFAPRIEELTRELRDRLRRYAIARKVRRVKELDDRHQRLQQVIDERAADPEMQNVPGGKTGLLATG